MPSRYNALIQERADLVAEGEEIFRLAEAEGRGLTAAEAERDDAINARLDALAGEIAREDARRERQLSVVGTQVATGSRISVRDRAEDDPRRGFVSLGDFGLAVMKAFTPGQAVDERLRIVAAPTNYHQETGSSSGDGYMLPPQFVQQIQDLVDAAENDIDLYGLMQPKDTSSNAVQLLVDETVVWSGNGIVANWRGEGGQMSATKLVTKGRSIRLWELYVFVLATEEMLADVAGLNQRLTDESAEAMRWKTGEAIFRGTGAAQPTGIINAASLVTQAAEGGQTSGTINATNVSKMYSRILNPSKAFWLVNPDAFPQLMLMSIANQPIWIPPSGFFAAPGGMLLGRPVYLTEHCESLGTAGDILLVNPDGYAAYRRSTDPVYAQSMHLYFDYAIQAFRWTFRFGGEPLLSAAVSPNKGSATKSHFVALAAR